MEEWMKEHKYKNREFKRHINPDSTEGGWVNIAAEIEPTVYIGPNAKVTGWPTISGNVRILDRAVVENGEINGNATVRDDAEVVDGVLTGNAEMSGRARIARGAEVRDNAKLSGGAVLDGLNTIISGDTHLHNIESYGSNLHISGGNFVGEPTMIGYSNLYLKVDDKTNEVTQVYQWVGEDKPLENADTLLKHVTYVKEKAPQDNSRGKGREGR